MKKIFKKVLLPVLMVCASVCAVSGTALLNAKNARADVTLKEVVLDYFKINETASVRMISPDGIRFTTTVDDATRSLETELKNKGYSVSYGALLCPTDLLGNTDLTFGALDDSLECDIPTKSWADEVSYNSVLSGTIDENGKITNMPSSFYNRPISARGYMKAELNGNTTYYYTANIAERSLGYVAAMSIANGSTSEQLEKFAQNTVFGLVDDIKLTTKTDNDGTLLSNKYKTSTENYPIVTLDGIPVALQGVQFSVENSDVATVEGGVVTAKGNGTTVLTATYTLNGAEKTASGTLTVSDEFVGESDYSILVPANATTKTMTAAKKFQAVFNESTGVNLPIITETGLETTAGKYISVGETSLAKTNCALTVAKSTASEVKTVGNSLFIRGLSDNGTLYGVQNLLGDIAGYEFYLKDTYDLNAIECALDLPEDRQYVPDIEYNYLDQNSDVNADYAMQMFYDGLGRVNGLTEYLHNSVLILNPDTYYATNKNWYATNKKFSWSSLKKEDVLITTNQGKAAELCYTAHGNAAAYQSMLETAANAIIETLKSNQSIEKLSFSISDGNYGWCDCNSCSAAGNASDNLLNFLNDLCENVENGLVGDSRQNSFKLLTLAYHQTNVAPTKVTSVNKHIEIWFGDSYGDYTKGLSETGSSKNAEIYKNFQGWAKLVGDADMLLWTYYSNTKCGFAPYNTFAAMRSNYAMAKAAGVDYVFNQTIQARSVWTMLKLYLASELAWNADPSDAEWENWINSYFNAAYGQGAAKMREWFDSWRSEDVSKYATSDSDPAIHRNIVSSSYFPKATLEQWVNYANAAIAALDKNDVNYTKYYNNIMLEKISPEYLLIEIYGDYGSNMIYASDFVGSANTWGIKKVGEVTSIDDTLAKYGEVLADKTITVETEFYAEKQSDGNFTAVIDDANIVNGDYNVTITTGTVVSAAAENGRLTVTVSGINEAQTYVITATASDGNITKFTNVLAVTKVIRTADDLDVLVTVDNNVTTNITGYYVLGGNIDASGYTTKAKGYNWSKGFAGTFDGRGYTVDGITAITCGLFGTVRGGTIKNVNFTNVTLGKGKENYDALFAGMGANLTISDVYVSYKDINLLQSYGGQDHLHGLLFSRKTEGYVLWTNITLDTPDVYIDSIFGAQLLAFSSASSKFNNVTVKVGSEYVLGYTEGNKNTLLTELPSGITIDTLPKIEVADEFVAEDGELDLEHESFIRGAEVKVTVNGTTKSETIVSDGHLTIDLKQYGITANGKYVVYVNVGEYSINFVNVTANFPLTFTVAVPETSAYYTFDGSEEAKQGKTYSFGINPTNAALNDFAVFVNDEEVECVDGKYTVENVQGNLTIKVIHGYIVVASGKTATVEYNGSTIKLINSTGVGHAYISAEYIAYMKSIGYTSVKFGMASDGNIAFISNYRYNDKIVQNKNSNTILDVKIDLVDSSTLLEFWGLDAEGKGYTIANKGGYIVITDLRFVKPAQGVDVSDEMYAEAGGETLLISDKFVVGDVYSVTANGETKTVTVTTDSQLSVNFTTLTAGKAYSAVCENENYKITFNSVFAATKVIRTAEDLSVLTTVGDTATTSITGYYVLGKDIDATGYITKATGYNWSKGFAGTFDGRGYTVDGITASTCGLFGSIYGGTIKNVNFINVTLPSNKSYVALFAGICQGLTMSDVNVNFKAINVAAGYIHGLLFSRATNFAQKWTNVTVDASEFVMDSIFGVQVDFTNANSAFENVTIKVKTGSVLGYTSGNKNTLLTEDKVPSNITIEYL